MPISEKICWEILNLAEGESVSSKWLKGEHCLDPNLQNAIPLSEIERILVLRYKKQQIEECVYFLEKRQYLMRHGFPGLTNVAYQLTESALAALKTGKFSPEEQYALGEAIIDVKQPSLWGMKLNLGELIRRGKKWFKS